MDYNSDFSHDLENGQVFERKLGNAFDNSKIEVKADFMAYITGNIFVEFESRGKKSGIATSKAEYYAFFVLNKTEVEYILLIEINKLKEIAGKYYKKKRIVKGGDNNTSRGVLIPINELIVR